MKPRAHMLIALVVMLVAVSYFLWREHATAGGFGFPLDHSWIHAHFARNLVLGNGFGCNPGSPTPGSTGPLWTLVMATGYLIAGDPVLSAKVIGVLLLGVSVFFVYGLAKFVSGDGRQALFAAVVAASLPTLTWASLSGMETMLAVMLTLAGLTAHVLYIEPGDRRQFVSTLLLGLASLARPECALFFAAAMLDRVLRNVLIRWRELAARDWLVPVVLHVIIFLAVVAPSLLFNKRFGFGMLPNTAYASAMPWKTGLVFAALRDSAPELMRSLTVRPFDYTIAFLQESLKANPLLFILGAFGFVRLVFFVPYDKSSGCESFVIPLSVILLPVGLGVFAPFGEGAYQAGRYTATVAPLMLIIGTVGLYGAADYAARVFSDAKFMGRPARQVIERTLVWILMLLALFAQFRSAWYRGGLYGREVANIQRMHVAVGTWVDQNLPHDAVLIADNVGGIAYHSQREMLDTAGRISPGVIRHLVSNRNRSEAIQEFMNERRPGYAVLFHSQEPGLVRDRAFLEPMSGVMLKDNVIAEGSELVVYRIRWGEFDSSE
jgi:hypothetical protein